MVQLTKVKENVDQAASEFAELRKGIPNYNEVIADIRQQQVQINRACVDASSSAQTIVSEVEEAAAKLCSSIDEEINTIKSVIGTGEEATVPVPPEPQPAPPQQHAQVAQGQGAPSGIGGPNQEVVAVQVAEALREYLKREIQTELSNQIAPLYEKMTELLIEFIQQRSRDR